MSTDTITGTTATPTPTASSTALAQTSEDYNMFLKLLTTQMTNQDPLEPMDSSEYTSQLVEYSQVEQSIQQTDTLNSILAALSTQSITQATGLIGNAAQFDTAVSGLSERADASWNYVAERDVTGITATVTDAKGKTVATIPLEVPAKAGTISWDGMLATGEKAPAGSYTLSIAATAIGGDKVPVAITSSGVVSEVVSGTGGVTLGVNGVQIPMAQLIKLTAPST